MWWKMTVAQRAILQNREEGQDTRTLTFDFGEQKRIESPKKGHQLNCREIWCECPKSYPTRQKATYNDTFRGSEDLLGSKPPT